jgi:hypothetical protein
MSTLSVDLAFKDYRDIGVVTLAKLNGRIDARAIPLSSLGLLGRPAVTDLADALVDLADPPSRQALVSGLAGVALEEGNEAGFTIAGVPPTEMDGTWREGFIVNPTHNVAAAPPVK